MIPRFPEFKAIDIGDRKEISRELEAYGSRICELAFSNLYIWKDFDRPSFSRLDGCLCIKIEPLDEDPFFLEPVGNSAGCKMLGMFLEMAGKVSRATESYLARSHGCRFELRPIRDHFDYIYLQSDLVELAGRAYDGKRNHIKRFSNKYKGYRYLPLGKDSIAKVMKVFDGWNASQTYDYVPADQRELASSSQRVALERAVADFERLHLIGGGLEVSGELAGFVIASPRANGLVHLHFLYALPDMPGIFQTLLWEAARNSFTDVEFINLEQDLGIPGLRKMKESYHPCLVEKKFELTKPPKRS